MSDTATSTASFGVLVIEGGGGRVDMLTDYLRREDIPVSITAGGREALSAVVAGSQPHMIILEAEHSLSDTLATCRRLRSASDAHIAVLTTDADTATTIAVSDAGADEVFADPTRSGDIASRVRTVLARRSPVAIGGAAGDAGPGKRFGPLTIDVERRLVFVSGRQIDLTRMEFDILVALSQRASRVTTRQELLNAVWGRGWQGNPGVIDVHIGHLRRKLGDDPTRPELVVNVRGVGYHLPGNP